MGIFIMFTSTNRTIWYDDSVTDEVKRAPHVIFDENQYASDNRPSMLGN